MKLISFLVTLASCVALAATEEQIYKNFTVTSGGTLVVDVELGSITVMTNSANEVAVDVWRKITRPKKKDEEEFLRDHPVTFEQDGNTVAVRCHYPDKKRSFKNNQRKRNEAKYTIRVPTEFNAELDTSGGRITVSDRIGEVKARTSGGGLDFNRLRGPLAGHTSGGGIDVRDCEGQIEIETSGGAIEVAGGGGSLEGKTSGGRVQVTDFQGDTSVETSGGGITIENVVGEIEGNTSGGGVLAVLPGPLEQPVSLSTSGGGVTVRVPATATFELDAKTSGGGVSSELPVTVTGKMDRDRLKGSVNGGGPTIRLRTSGGGIHVREL